MAKLPRTSKKAPNRAGTPTKRTEDVFAGRYPPRPETGPPEVVDPRWLLKAAAFAILAALVCAYATLCLLVYQGQWQLLLHPVVGAPLNAFPLNQSLRFGAGETGQPQLAGMWLPAPTSPVTTPTILYLPDGAGNLSGDTRALEQLHQLPLNVFAFDYRGFGASASSSHPTEKRMAEDAESAYEYLTNTRHISPATIVPYGVGLGASLAAGLCTRHKALPALIIESPIPDAAGRAGADPRARIVPLRLFFHERFEIAGRLSTLKTPKLLLAHGPSDAIVNLPDLDFTRFAHAMATPAFVSHSAAWNAENEESAHAYRAALLRFLDQYLALPLTGPGSRPTP